MFLYTASFFLIILASLINDVTAPLPNLNNGDSNKAYSDQCFPDRLNNDHNTSPNNTPYASSDLIFPFNVNEPDTHFDEESLGMPELPDELLPAELLTDPTTNGHANQTTNDHDASANNNPSVVVEGTPFFDSNATSSMADCLPSPEAGTSGFSELSSAFSVPNNTTSTHFSGSYLALLGSATGPSVSAGFGQAGTSGLSQAGTSGLSQAGTSGFSEAGTSSRDSMRKKTSKYLCDVCGKDLKYASSLKRHQRKHTGEKPYQCETCGNTFSRACNLKKHQRTHTGEKPYQCETCGNTFAQASTLKNHQRTHTGEKPYQCETCDKTFAQAYDLKRHQKSQHKNDPKKPRLEKF